MIFIKKSLYNNALALYVYQVSNTILPFIVFPLLARGMNIEEFGYYTMFMAFIVFSSVIIDYGFLISGTYYIARNKENNKLVNKLVTIIIASKLILYFLYCVLLGLFNFYLKFDIKLYLYFILILFFQGFMPIWYYRGIQKMWGLVFSTILDKIIFGVLYFYFKENINLYTILNITLISNFISFIFSYLIIYKIGFKIEKIILEDILLELKENFEYYLSRLSVIFYTSGNVNLIGFFSPVQAGFYSISENFYKAGVSLTSPLSNALFPYMASNKDWKLFFKQIIFLSFIVLFFTTIQYFYIREIIIFLFGAKYLGVIPISKVLIMTSFVTFLSINFGYSAFSALERNDIPNKSTSCGALFFIINIIGLYFFGEINAYNIAIIFFLTEFFVLLYRLIYFFRLYSNEKVKIAH